ncbi:MAG TPA: alkaline phosphatase [Bryobacteraceae bacterium]|nr:alkaline phosphatase [Bryobacteraceae bacterium]HOL71938.1 alkaline phosphatase [Bryobacteraceae bacterium]HOQ45245.1 alkaline phosphatase [Bryobacteraceae bacterium]HPQ15264.1 alkaline phosphatase [Bryobacteraceae bacterium]HPU71443.1 alkaline phosphatase [Bryobacteraceae bacterium]
MLRYFLVLTLIASSGLAAPRRAKNVILFLGDAGGIPTLHAASLYKHNHPQKLFLQSMPHIGLSDTSSADAWVTDSAAGMSAIVTGQKTNNGVISQSASAIRGKQEGEALQTILEHAEQRGLSTGVLTNMAVTDATPAACYAHSSDRSRAGEIFAQVLKPRFGDGVDVIIGAGRKRVIEATSKMGLDIEAALREKGFAIRDSLSAISEDDRRVVALFDTADFDVSEAVRRAIAILSKNSKGYFLMVEWDMHTDRIRRGLERVIEMDEAIRKTAGMVGPDTLILFTADHSFDLRVRGGRPGQPLLPDDDSEESARKGAIRMDNGHTGEQVLVAAQGPGAERVRGFLANTDIFHIMMAAYGWEKEKKR